ncbi:hypothetical protein PHYSODRAFT_298850 [Phytophthora sojae]|uniref:Ankyrin repeat protein n=1 Tax=Phytophthora sojae (strain P6497) TaxID=1094619 RepID=G4Z5C1_PHYSP|nr:hypothetical protein PHYSODRAFT_298850 [Phytophthora sojae]EGZ20906.1 hypothetical protein PHYSODRAFT_298850 [Phytophthora sojae]|eukprot:XP_009523623.1 hypothetical protein PHYSODRAFT_298850 [Phytophthora sojae]
MDQVESTVLKEAFVAAAREDHLEVVRTLRLEFRSSRTGRREYEAGVIVKDAIVAAARAGHLAIVKYLLKDLPERDFGIRWRILDEGAAHGHLRVVEFGAELTTQFRDLTHEYSDALRRATSGGHLEVVKYLLKPGKFTWRYLNALEHAVAVKQRAIAELIYRRLEQQCGCDIVLDLVESGKFQVVRFLCSNDLVDTKLFEAAFIKAASLGSVDVLEFLLKCKGVSSEVSDKAFVRAASAGIVTTMEFLYGKGQVSREALLATFESSRSAAVVEFVYDEVEGLPVESVCLAVENAAFCGSINGVDYCPGEDQCKILQFLSNRECIPPEIVNKVFTEATQSLQPVVLMGLSHDKALESELIGDAFVRAAESGCLELVAAWLGLPCISGDVVIAAFNSATACDRRDIVAILFDVPGTKRSVQEQAVVTAARCSCARVLKYICDRGDWPVEVLEKARGLAHSKKIKKFLDKKLNLRSEPGNTPISRFDKDGSFVG